jgi:hypothetical protein
MILMKKLILLVLLILPWGVIAQQGKIVSIEGSAQVEFPDYKSRQQVEKEAEDQAIINALENAFGRAVIESNSTYLSNINTGKKVETNTCFNMIANTLVKGEVLNVLDKKCEEVPGIKLSDGRKIPVKDLKCTVKIEARELSESLPEFESSPLACIHIKCKTTGFKNNDPFYLYFKSPVSGFLTVFLDDGKKSQRLLPYQGMTGKYEDEVPINADQEYYLFSREKQYSYFGDDNQADEYNMVAETIQDQNRIFIVFSTTPIPKPGLKEGMGIEELSDFEKQGGWKVPKALSSEDFQGWLIKNRIHNRNISVKTIDITITK